jgi:hypothetical protein
MKLTALANLPNGIKTGDHFEVPDYQGELLLRAKVVTRDEEEPVAKRRPTYRRRDMTADTTTRNGLESDGDTE